MRQIISLMLLVPALVWADTSGDAKQLKDEALAILKANSNKAATPEEYATCIMKLEKAQGLLEAANETDSPLAQEVSSSLFWARRFSNVDVINALQKMRGGAPVAARQPIKPAAPAKPVVPVKPVTTVVKTDPVEPPEVLKARAAEKAFSAAQSFAASNAADDYAVALRWFQMASEHSGTDAALKALELAREAQKRHLVSVGAVTEKADELPDSPDMAQVKQADGLAERKSYEEAIKLYRDAIKQKDETLIRRRLAKALYFRAQQIKDALKPKFEANAQDYKAAWNGAWMQTPAGRFFNNDNPELVRVKRETDALRKEGDVAFRYFQESETEFKAILKSVPGGKDFEAAGYVGLCQCVRPFFKSQGQNTLKAFVKEYAPANDFERTLYEFCKAEIDRIYRGG